MIKGLILQVPTKKDLLHNIDRTLIDKKFANVISLNPENAIIATENETFKRIYLQNDSLVVADGVGIVWASRLFGIRNVDRVPGVDLLDELVKQYRSKRIVFLGGKEGTATKVANYYKDNVSTSGEYFAIPDIDKHDRSVIDEVMQINPDILFVAFGSPAQEIWINQNKDKLRGVLCMGVGGSFDFLAGRVSRAPQTVRKRGFEWLYRLYVEPWRVKRQLRLFRFVGLVLFEWLKSFRFA